MHYHPAVELNPTLRAEQGPARKRATATRELLSDAVTARHYHLPRTIRPDGSVARENVDPTKERAGLHPGEKLMIAHDAEGRPIMAEGQEIEYLDWRSRTPVWYLYQWNEEARVELRDPCDPLNPERDYLSDPAPRWMPVGAFNDVAALKKAAQQLDPAADFSNLPQEG